MTKEKLQKIKEKVTSKKAMKITAALLMVGIISQMVEPHLFASTIKDPSSIIDSGTAQITKMNGSMKKGVQAAVGMGGLVALLVAAFGDHIMKGARDAGKAGLVACVAIEMALQVF